MLSNYKEKQRFIQRSLIKNSNIFNGIKGYGYFRGIREEILQNSDANLYWEILDDAKKYFNENEIVWWLGGKNRPTAHTLSSQIACINHLFLIRNDKEIVLKILNNIMNEFIDVLPIPCDKESSYISFEVTSYKDRLNEANADLTRGSNCTSIDALIYAKHMNGELWLIPIEWKYTEIYNNQDKSLESIKSKQGNINNKGEVRLRRYSNLINDSQQLKTLNSYRSSIYFFEPFYQLMRQTLWAEQIIKNQNEELIKASNYLHLHIIPKGNNNLLCKKYMKNIKGLENNWRQYLHDQTKYKIIDPSDFLDPIIDKYPNLYNYLKIRYWQI